MTNETAIQKWLEGVKNVSISFRPVIYQTNAIPSKSDIIKALQILSRLADFNGFIDVGSNYVYAQQVYYALEHIQNKTWNRYQLAAACTVITATLSTYLHYDPTIGNGITYQTKCFHKTLHEIDKVYLKYNTQSFIHNAPLYILKKVIPCCLTPYYKYNTIKDPDAPSSFKYKKKKSSSEQKSVFDV